MYIEYSNGGRSVGDSGVAIALGVVILLVVLIATVIVAILVLSLIHI